MKKFLLTFVCSLWIGSCCIVNAESIKTDEESNQIIRLDEKKPDNPNRRPNMPSRWYIICSYSSSHLRFILPDPIDNLYITLGDEMFPIWEGFVNKANPTTAIPNLTGEVKIMCEDNLGRKYYGTLYFDED